MIEEKYELARTQPIAAFAVNRVWRPRKLAPVSVIGNSSNCHGLLIFACEKKPFQKFSKGDPA
jgi:hypothetical protein